MRDGFSYNFSLAELGIAGEMSKRQVQHLCSAGLLPDPDGVRRAKRATVVGALVCAGFSLLAAGRLAAAIASESNQYDGEVPENIDDVARAIDKARPQALASRVSDGLFVYSVARTDPKFLSPFSPLDGDIRVRMIDGRWLFWDWTRAPLNVIGAVERLDLFAEIRSAERGADLDIIPASERPHRTDAEIRKFIHNAVSTFDLNVSLAIRNGYERLLDEFPRITSRAKEHA